MLKTAVIGVGGMGANHARVLSEISNLQAVCDLQKKTAAEVAKKYKCKPYTNFEEMLKKEQIEAVTVAVPTKNHLEVATKILQIGVNVLVEKPITETVKDAKTLLEIAEKSKQIFMVGHIERFNPAVQALKKVVDNQELGRILSLSVRRVGVYPARDKQATVITDLAIHDVDVFNFLLEKQPTNAMCASGSSLNTELSNDYATLLLLYGTTHASIEVNWLTPVKIRKLWITAEQGYAELDYIDQTLTLLRRNFSRDYDEYGKIVTKFGEPTQWKVPVKKQEPLVVELKHFLDCVKKNKKPIITGEEALQALQALESLKTIEPNEK